MLFDEASKHIPHNAITVEIAPHGLLQAILKRSLNKGITNIALTQRGHPDCSECVFTALGKYVSFLFIHLFVYGPFNDTVCSSRPYSIKWKGE